MLRSETIDPLADSRWQDFVESSETGGIFHHVEWLRLLHAQYGYSMLARCAIDAGGEIHAGLPFAHIRSRLTGSRLVAVPFSDMCSPVLRDPGEEDSLRTLIGAIQIEHERTGVEAEIRTEIADLGHSGAAFYSHELSLEPDLDAVRQGFGRSVRYGVSRAEREGIEVRRATTTEALEVFYDLHLRTRRRLGVPTQPKRFIKGFARLFEQGLGFVLVAHWEGEPVAAAVFLTFNGVLTYKYSASSPAHLKKRPNNALLMEAIRWGCEHEQHTFDLGRTEVENEGLREFKQGWGTRERELAYTHLGAKDRGLERGGVPGIVKTVISRTPPITGRLAGAALYRHFG